MTHARPALVLAACLAAAAATAAQIQPRDPQSASRQAPAVGTAVIAGTVTMAGSTQPARRVRVMLSSAELRGGRSATTDEQGQFAFTALPAGRYSVSASKPGHVSVTFGQRLPGRPGTPIDLSDGEKFRADLQIPRGSVVTGTIMDEYGEPAPQTPVRALRVATQNGRRTLQGGPSATTDDRGIYRIFNLMPGEYVLCATPRNSNTSDADRMRLEMENLRRQFEAVSREGGDQARAIGERIASLQASMPEGDETAPPGYAPICYPGTASATAATPVPLGVSEERPGIDIQLQLMPLARVEGTVVNGTGAQVRDITVTLSDPQQPGASIANINARADREGHFRLMNVPPGQYRVTARATLVPESADEPGGRGGARGRGGPPNAQRPNPTIVWAAADLAVDGRSLANVLLSLQRGVSVSGRVRFDGQAPPPADLTRLRVTMSPAEPSPFGGPMSGQVEADGRFTIPSVAPGRYRLTAGGVQGWTVDGSEIGGRDALDVPVEITGAQNITGAQITFGDRQTELSGTVTDEQQQPVATYTLVIFPDDRRYWISGSRRVQSVRPSTDGQYTFRNLPPGDYRLAPVYDLEPGALSDPEFLQQLETTALRITLQPGEKKRQDMGVGR